MQNRWIYDSFIPFHELLLFQNAMGRHIDIYDYYPLAGAKREEDGLKYRFLCIAREKCFPFAPVHFTDIEIYKPVRGMPYATRLFKIPFHNISRDFFI